MRTRIAPSPTGAFHLGNARTFLINFLLARQSHWTILLRIEDLDGPRIKPHAAQQALDDLHWLTLSYDAPPLYQSSRLPQYHAALQSLLDQNLAYPCTCSRKDVQIAASAPHLEDAAPLYPGTCRNKYKSIQQALDQTGRPPAIRFKTPSQTIRFHDQFAGPQSFNAQQDLGDFVIAKSDLTPSYQLAVVLDDAHQLVTHVVRGDDLLSSTPKQILLYHALNLSPQIPTYYHLPLITGPDHRRLAKRHGDTRLSHYKNQNVPPQKILALLAKWIGLPSATPQTAADLLNDFNLNKIPRHPIIFTPHDEASLFSI